MGDHYQHHLVLRGEDTLLFGLYKQDVTAEHEQSYAPGLAWLDRLRVLLTRSQLEAVPAPEVERSSFVVLSNSPSEDTGLSADFVGVKFVTNYMDDVEEFVDALSRVPSLSLVQHEFYSVDGSDDVFRRNRWLNGKKVAAAEGSLFLQVRYDPYPHEVAETGRVVLMEERNLSEGTTRFYIEVNGEECDWEAARGFARAVFDEEQVAYLEEAHHDFPQEALAATDS